MQQRQIPLQGARFYTQYIDLAKRKLLDLPLYVAKTHSLLLIHKMVACVFQFLLYYIFGLKIVLIFVIDFYNGLNLVDFLVHDDVLADKEKYKPLNYPLAIIHVEIH